MTGQKAVGLLWRRSGFLWLAACLMAVAALPRAGANAASDPAGPRRPVDNDAIAWVQQLGTEKGEDANAIAYDPVTDSVYLAGTTQGAGFGGLDAFIARYDSSGNKICERGFGTGGNDGATGVAVDGKGNAYIGGFTPSAANPLQPDGWVALYNGDCEEQWVRVFGISSGGDGIADLGADASGNVYLAGWTREPNDDGCSCNNTDVLIAKFSPSGSQLWVKKFGTFEEDRARGIAVLPDGNFYVTGRWAGNSEADGANAYVARFNSSGTQTWLQQIASDEREFGEAVAVDDGGNAYAVGWTSGTLEGTNRGARDGWLAKYTAAGSRAWVRQFGSDGGDEALGVAVTGPVTGTVTVVGETTGQIGSVNHGSPDAFAIRYAADGSQQKAFQLGTASSENANAVAIDGLEQVYIAGGTGGDWGGPQAGGGDAFVLRLGQQCVIEGEVFTRPEQNLTYYLYGALVTLRQNGAVVSRAKTQRPFGKYSLQGPCTDNLVVRVELEHTRFDTSASSLFRILYQTQGGPVAYVETQPFSTIGQTEPTRKDIIWVDGFNSPPLVTRPTIQANRDRFDDLAMIYAHTYEAWQFSDEIVSQQLDFALPVDVIAYSTGNGVFWSGSNTQLPNGNNDPFIHFDAASSPYSDWGRPQNREWHEFGHHVMADLFGNLMPQSPGDVNHGGAANNSFVNPSTTDAWTEGFAEFYGMAVGKYVVGRPQPHIYAGTNLEGNYIAWNDEEYAVAGLLWDLVDPPDAGDISILGGRVYADCVQIPLGTLWSYLDTDWGDAVPKSGTAPADYGYIFDVKHLYDVLVLKGVGNAHSRGLPQSDLEELFIAHGFFGDIDDSSAFEAGEEIGRSADKARPNRRRRPQIPGSFIRFDATDAETGAPLTVERFTVSVRFDPPFEAFNYSVDVQPGPDGRLYYYGPDSQYPSTTTVTAHSGGKSSLQPLSFTNESYWQQMAAKPADSFVQHQFRLEEANRLFLPSLRNGSSQRTDQRAGQGADRAAVPCAPGTPTPTPTPTATATPSAGAPQVQSIAPTSVPQGQAVQVTIRGLNFQPGANVFIGSTPLQNVSQPNTQTLVGTVPASLPPGTYNVVVVNPGGATNQLPGGFTVTGGTSTPTATSTRAATATPTATTTPTQPSGPTATPTATPTSGVAVLASDDFSRSDADRCALGQTSGYAGGTPLYYLPLWPANGSDPSNPIGANLISQALQNNGQDLGGVMLTGLPGACSNPGIRGINLGQDLYVRVDVLVPTANGYITQAGPFLRGRAAARGDGLGGGSNTGFWAFLDSTGKMKIVDLSNGSTIGEGSLGGFDPSRFYTLEMTAQGSSIRMRVTGPVARDGRGGAVQQLTLAVTVPEERAGANTDGTVGISFGAGANRGQMGGQRADNFIVTDYQPLR